MKIRKPELLTRLAFAEELYLRILGLNDFFNPPWLVLRQGFFEGCNPSKNSANPIQPPLNFKLTDH
jgi:hypothetical protein